MNNGSVELNNCTVGSLYLSGINGEVVDSSIVATDCKIGSFFPPPTAALWEREALS